MASTRLAHGLIDFASVPNLLENFYLLGPMGNPKIGPLFTYLREKQDHLNIKQKCKMLGHM